MLINKRHTVVKESLCQWEEVAKNFREVNLHHYVNYLDNLLKISLSREKNQNYSLFLNI